MTQFEVGGFTFQLPHGWYREPGSGPAVFHSPGREELILSISAIAGTGTNQELDQIRKQIWSNAIESARRAVMHPELRIVKDFSREPGSQLEDCSSVHAETRDGTTVFRAFVASTPSTVLLGTFEASTDPETEFAFGLLVQSLRVE